ncbi:MAG: F0F1 ATP synthase subunit A [Chloroflexales bacterium]|nr:F0F1 ATP synthase subunit A [Chloroflexales bacterium]
MRNRILTVLGVAAIIGIVLYFLGIRMTKDDLHISAAAEPLACLGGQIVGEHCSPGTFFPITNSLVMTILVDLILVSLIVFVGRNLQLVPRGLQNALEALIAFFYDFARGVDAKNVGKFFVLPATILFFFMVGNVLALVPGVGSIGVCRAEAHAATVEGAASAEGAATAEGAAAEGTAAEAEPLLVQRFPAYCGGEGVIFVPWLRAPAADLNVTFAFALVAVFMVEFWGFQALGIGYLGKFFINPFKEGAIMTFVGILEFISEIMRIVAFAFRIFGNIFGGEVVLAVMSFLFAYLLPLPFYGLEVFVALIQAVIFAVLTVVFAALAVQPHAGHGDDDHGHATGEKAVAAH